MSRVILAATLAAASVCAFAAKKPAQLTQEQIKVQMEEEQRLCGGIHYKPNSLKGEIVYVNCQTSAPDDWLQFSVRYFSEETKFKITIKKGSFNLTKPEIQGSASLFIVDDAALPPILCAPESRWTVVNVSPLKSDKPGVFEARVKKQLSRGFAFLCGGGESQFRGTLMSVTSTAMLDAREDHVLPVDVLDRFADMMKPQGVTPAVYDDYANACQDGWAPLPTNDVQKAIWTKVHDAKERGPEKALKIVPPKK